MGHIYCYTNLTNNKKYVGQSINPPEERQKLHLSNSKNEKSNEYESPLHRAMRLYGIENFKYEVLANDIYDIDLLNMLEIYYIDYYNCQIPNGYNIEPGGKNCEKPKTEEQKEHLRWLRGYLTEEEVIELRLAYKNKESPSVIYNEGYKDIMHYNSFLNIWTGKRYSNVMPEVFEDKGRHTKLTEEIVRQMKEERKNTNASYDKLAQKYGVSKSTVAGIF